MTRMMRRWMLAIGVLVLAAGLALDLSARGLAWQFFWSQTGEEEPLAQIRAMVEWVGNLTRPQPSLNPLTPVNHTGDTPWGINTFLQLEPDPAKVEQQVKQISEVGFTWIRQEFPWEDIEIHARGDFSDRRNESVIGVVDAWAKYDRIVALTEQYGIQIQARISNPPTWAQESAESGDMAPPVETDDYVRFAQTLAERYKGRLRYYQIWNEPNIYPEWGENSVDPEAYTDMLCRTYAALKAIDPQIVVISGALAPTVSLTDRDLNEFIFLQRMYDAGAGACFDVLSMQGYGLNSGYTDRRLRTTTVNVNRSLYIRDMMVANGDAHKPIWISEAAWNSVPSEAEDPSLIDARYNFGQVTREQAAEYITGFYERIDREWPWVGVVNYWFMTLPDDSRRDESFYYFRLVEPYYSPEAPRFEPLPVYDALKSYIAAKKADPVLYTGTYQLETHWAVVSDGQPAPLNGAQFDSALLARQTRISVYGTDVRLRWFGGTITVQIDGVPTQTYTRKESLFTETHLRSSLLPARYDIVIESRLPAYLDTLQVNDRSSSYWIALIVVVVVVALALLRARTVWGDGR